MIAITWIALISTIASCESPTPIAHPTDRAEVIPIESVTPTLARTPTITPASSQKINFDLFAPPGRARDLVIQNCGTCHSFMCPFRGQRTLAHWQTIEYDMRDKVSQLSDADYAAIFAYLKQNFNDTLPAPNIPPALETLGCDSGVR